MSPIDVVIGPCVSIDSDDVDTDQIIPARHLLRPGRAGLGAFAFENSPARAALEARHGAPILLAGRNFGCGSSREHAVWTLADRGVRVVVSPSPADIFATGLLAVTLPEAVVCVWRARATAEPDFVLRVDLGAQSVADDANDYRFAVDPFARRCLLGGLDPVAVTLRHVDAIERHERGRPTDRPRVQEAS
jgi:3-isopropylmalate dehydratase small subunit